MDKRKDGRKDGQKNRQTGPISWDPSGQGQGSNNTDNSRFVLKTKYDTDKSDLEKKINDTSVLVKKQITMLKLVK